MKKTVHHVTPRSRLRGKGILGVCRIPEKQHDLYHQLVGNMTPVEAFHFLNETFWKKLFVVETFKENGR